MTARRWFSCLVGGPVPFTRAQVADTRAKLAAFRVRTYGGRA